MTVYTTATGSALRLIGINAGKVTGLVAGDDINATLTNLTWTTTGSHLVAAADNVATAFKVTDGSNDYISVNTTNSSEVMAFGSVAISPVMNFLGTGQKTMSGNLDATGGVDVTGANLTVPSDTYKLVMGVGADLEVYHDGTNSIIDNNTGNLLMYLSGNTSSDYFIIKNSGGTDRFTFAANGDLVVKGNLTVDGVTITGTYEEVNISDNTLLLNYGYTTAAAQTGGLAVNYLPTATADTVAATGFVAANVTPVQITGVGATNDSTTLTGTGTFFTKELAVGYTITFDWDGTPQTRVIDTITSDTVLDVTAAFTGGSLSGKNIKSAQNPQVFTTGSATFADGDLVQVSGAFEANNNGLFEVLKHVGTTLIIRGTGQISTIEDFTQTSFVTDTTVQGALTKVTVSVLRAGSDGNWEVGKGAVTPVTFADLGVSGGSGWSRDIANAQVYLTTATDEVTVGANPGASPKGKLAVIGDTAAQIQLYVQADASQSADLISVKASNGSTNLFRVDSTGVAISGASLYLDGVSTPHSLHTTTSALDIDSAAALQINSVGTLSIANDPVAQTINIGTGAAAQSINIGTTGAGVHTVIVGSTDSSSPTTLQAGTGALTLTAGGILDVNATGAVTIDTAATISLDGVGASNFTTDSGNLVLASTTSGSVLVDAVGSVELNSSGAAISIGNDAVAQNINIGTGAAARTVTIGNQTGATSLVLDAGTGNIDIGTGAQARTINIGTGADAQTITIGSQTSSSMTIDAGTGGINIGTTGQARTVNFATGAAVQTVTMGSTNSTSSMAINSGTGNIDIGATAQARAINVGTGAAAQTITVGNATGATTVDINTGTGGLTVDTTSGGAISLDAVGAASNFSVSGADLTLATTTSGTLILDAVAALDVNAGTGITVDGTTISIDGTSTSNFSTTGANLTVSTITSGTLAVTSAADVDINAATGVTVDGTTISIDGTSTSNLTVTGAGLTVSTATSGALTLTSAAAATWSTSGGALTVDSAAALNLGTSAATGVTVGKTAVTTDILGPVKAEEGIWLPDNQKVAFGNTAAAPDITSYWDTTVPLIGTLYWFAHAEAGDSTELVGTNTPLFVGSTATPGFKMPLSGGGGPKESGIMDWVQAGTATGYLTGLNVDFDNTYGVSRASGSGNQTTGAFVRVIPRPDVYLSTSGGGTVEINGTDILTGTATTFLSEPFVVGDTIIFDPTGSPQTRVIASIDSDTQITVTVAFTGTISGKDLERVGDDPAAQYRGLVVTADNSWGISTGIVVTGTWGTGINITSGGILMPDQNIGSASPESEMGNIYMAASKGLRLHEGGAPTFQSARGWVYTKNVSTVTELWYMNGSGTEVQITSGSGLNVPAVTLDSAYNGGSSITVDAGAVTLTSATSACLSLDASAASGAAAQINHITGTATNNAALDVLYDSGSINKATDVWALHLVGVSNAGAGDSVGFYATGFDYPMHLATNQKLAFGDTGGVKNFTVEFNGTNALLTTAEAMVLESTSATQGGPIVLKTEVTGLLGIDQNITTTGTAGQVVYVNGANTFDLADASAIATAQVAGVLINDPSGSAARIAIPGSICPIVGSFAGGDVGQVVYLSETAGSGTTTAPSTGSAVVYKLGILVDDSPARLLYLPQFITVLP